MTAVDTAKGKAFGSASTLVAQMGILLGMIVSNQSQPALVVASAASAISGSFGDAFSMYISETTAKAESPLVPAVSVLITKLVIGAVYIGLFFSVSNRSVLIPVAILLDQRAFEMPVGAIDLFLRTNVLRKRKTC